MPISLKYAVVDAFTNKIFGGNPAAVVVLDEQTNLDDRTLQSIAREFNVSETAFVRCRKEIEGTDPTRKFFGLRWFTPNMEFALCGHATVAATHVLSGLPNIVPTSIKTNCFDTISGALTAQILPGGRIQLELPAGETQKADETLNARVKEATRKAMGENGLKILFVGKGSGISFGKYVLVEINENFDLFSATVDASPFLALAPEHCAFMFTSTTQEPGVTFVSRVFGPAFGADEDPVCGSAHGMLAPYWHRKLGLEARTRMLAHQVSERGGFIEAQWDELRSTCKLTGEAVVSMKGEIFLQK